MTEILTGKYLSVKQYAKKKGISRQAVNKQILKGKIEALKIGGRYLIKI
jgi:excisionase family DNA binding protein